MRVSRTVLAGAAVAAALIASIAGCGGKPASTSTSTSGSATSATSARSSAPASPTSAQPNAYANLLIQASDINAPIQFNGGPPTNLPDGQPGVAATFSTDDNSHIIKDTIQVLADPAAATNALNAAKGDQSKTITNPTAPRPFNVGTGGTTVTGKSPDNSKGVLILMFTEGKAFVTLEFDGPVDSLPPEDFVTDVGQKQDAAVKKGLGG